MTKCALLVAIAGLAVTGVAKADFIFTGDFQDAGNGLERVPFYALNNGADRTGTKALASEVTIQDMSRNALVIKFVNATGTAKADLTGRAFLGNGGLPTDSDRTFVNLLPDPSDPSYDPTAYTVVSTDPPNIHVNFLSGLSQLEVAGANLSGGVDATRTANGGKGALIAVAVAPLGDGIHLFGSIGGDTGTPQPFDVFSPVPEPGTAVLLLVSAGALLLPARSHPEISPRTRSCRVTRWDGSMHIHSS